MSVYKQTLMIFYEKVWQRLSPFIAVNIEPGITNKNLKSNYSSARLFHCRNNLSSQNVSSSIPCL